MDQSVREARLKPEYADRYPPITPNVWMAAAEIGATMLFWHIRSIGGELPESRLLEDDHFEFRGGWDRGDRAELRTRVTDTNGARPPHAP